MNIDPLSNYGYTQHSQSKARANGGQPGKTPEGATERLSVELTSTIRDIFASTPEIRPEVVERGRQLLFDPSYPSQEIVGRIAALVTPFSEE
jgi:hypothetical protein